MGTKHKLGLHMGQVDQGLIRGVWVSLLSPSPQQAGILRSWHCVWLQVSVPPLTG